jgi:hypothetical protein
MWGIRILKLSIAASLPLAQPPESAFKRSFQLSGCAVNCLLECCGFVAHGDGTESCKTRFHQTALVIRSGFGTVLVAEVNLHPREPRVEAVKQILHSCFNMAGKSCAPLDAFISVDLNVHTDLLSWRLVVEKDYYWNVAINTHKNKAGAH